MLIKLNKSKKPKEENCRTQQIKFYKQILRKFFLFIKFNAKLKGKKKIKLLTSN